MTDAATGLTIMRKGPKRLVLEQMHKMIGQSELRYLARTFGFDWMYFHFDELEAQIPEKPLEH